MSAITETGARARTRRAILDAAVSVLSTNPQASLADIATAAAVGRTTVHRYFPERADLITAIGADAQEKIELATARARLEDGDAVTALNRLCQEYFEFGDVFLLMFTMPELLATVDWDEKSDEDRAVEQLIVRGQREGSIDPELDNAWVQQLVWSLLYSAWELVRTHDAAKHHALSQCLLTLSKALAP